MKVLLHLRKNSIPMQISTKLHENEKHPEMDGLCKPFPKSANGWYNEQSVTNSNVEKFGYK